MSVQSMSQVLTLSKMRLGARLVLLAIANHANAEGLDAWPSVASIAREAGLSESQAHRGIRAAVLAGELRVQVGSGPHATNVYQITLGGCQIDRGVTHGTGVISAEKEVGGGVISAQVGVSSTAPKSSKRTILREPSSIGRPSVCRFDEFWQVYPKRVKKKPSLAKWKAKNLDRFATGIIFDVKNRIEKDGRWLAGFIPDPLTYLNQERWTDELQPKDNAR